MVFNQISQPRQRVSLRIAFSELDALSGSKTSGCTTSPHLRFSNHGRSSGSQTDVAHEGGPRKFSNHGRSGGSQTNPFSNIRALSSATMADRAVLKHFAEMFQCRRCSATMADRAGLKPVGADTLFEQGLSISKNCKICQVFLFQRPARPFLDQAYGSPQASIPALTAVWIHYSRTIP